MSEDAFYYKIEVNIDENTLPIFGPFLEYYDNNFEIITGAFDKVVKEYIYGAAKRMKRDADTDDNLPSVQQEAVNPLDVRVYEMDFVMSYPLGLGFEITDVHNIIRAIPDVTTIPEGAEKPDRMGETDSFATNTQDRQPYSYS